MHERLKQNNIEIVHVPHVKVPVDNECKFKSIYRGRSRILEGGPSLSYNHYNYGKIAFITRKITFGRVSQKLFTKY